MMLSVHMPHGGYDEEVYSTALELVRILMEKERREEGGKGGRGQGDYRGMELKLETAGGWGGLVRAVRSALRFARVPAILLCYLKIRFLSGRPDGTFSGLDLFCICASNHTWICRSLKGGSSLLFSLLCVSVALRLCPRERHSEVSGGTVSSRVSPRSRSFLWRRPWRW